MATKKSTASRSQGAELPEAGEILRNGRHEKFAQMVAAGSTYIAAYREIYRQKCNEKTAMGEASRLANRADVAARVAHIREAAAEGLHWDLKERLRFLRKGAMNGKEKFSDRLRALELYSKLTGDLTNKSRYAKTAPSVPLTRIIARIRAGRSE